MASTRTLLLSPPSLSSHPERLDSIVAAHDRKATDIQMLDRLALSLIILPESTYDVVLLLLDASGSTAETLQLLSRETIEKVVQSMKPGGSLHMQGEIRHQKSSSFMREAILAGLIEEDGVLRRPSHDEMAPVQINLRKMSQQQTASAVDGTRDSLITTIPKGVTLVNTSRAGIGGEDSDEDLIDENTLLDEEDKKRPIIQPPECRPKPGKRRRACKDCTCGLAQKLEAEDKAKRSDADANLAKLGENDLAEIDFTVKGKVGSCGNCALGDAFRCDGCPYIGLPPFKPGEEVRLTNDDVQL